LPAPSAAARAALGPYARGRLVEKALGQTLSLDVPWDVFASQAVDDGTLLLLQHLPQGEPRSVLDLGCGYGALGLPVALAWPDARCLLVDRDLLAVAAAAHNARALGLRNVEVQPGLGYRGLAGRSFDWVLCNVPARIGPQAMRALLLGGRALGAEVRAVVIRDLADAARGMGMAHVASGPRHDVFALAPGPGTLEDDDGVYARDETAFRGMLLQRPHDASEDPSHAKHLELLAEALPRKAPRRALVFRAGYGRLALFMKAQWPQAQVVAQERDLLDAAFLRRNAEKLGLAVEVQESLFPGGQPGSCSLVAGEFSSPAGRAVAVHEAKEAARLLEPGGEALLLASEKQERDWLSQLRGATVLLRREGASVLRISRPTGGG